MKDESPTPPRPLLLLLPHEGRLPVELLGTAEPGLFLVEERDGLVGHPLHQHAQGVGPADAGGLEHVAETTDLRVGTQRPVDARLERNAARDEGAGHRHQRDLAGHHHGAGVGRQRLGDVERVLVVHDDVDHRAVAGDDGLLATVGFDREHEGSDLQT